MAEEQQSVLGPISFLSRMIWAIVAGGFPAICWRLLAGSWPGLKEHWWFWAICGSAAVLAYGISPFVIASCRYARLASHVNSDSFRLKQSNFWTEVQHNQEGGASQVMRMQDGNYIILSIGASTAKVLLTPELTPDALNAIRELASFPLVNEDLRLKLSRQQRMKAEELSLELLRRAIGWPKSVEELRQILNRKGPITQL